MELEEPVKIVDNLYLGDKKAAKNFEALQRLGITHVINVTEPRTQGGVHNFFEGKSIINYLRIPVQDTDLADIAQYFDRANDFIDEARSHGYSVLVHCQLGQSRSPTVVMSYLMTRMNMKLVEAYTMLRRVRPEVKPKQGFISQLLKLEKRLLSNNNDSNANTDEILAKKRKAADTLCDAPDSPSKKVRPEPSESIDQHSVTSASAAADDDNKSTASSSSSSPKRLVGASLPPHLRAGLSPSPNLVSASPPRQVGAELPPHLRARQHASQPADLQSQPPSSSRCIGAEPRPASKSSSHMVTDMEQKVMPDAVKRSVGPALPPHLAARATLA